ncbi:Uncharacterised protein [Amycolatopsis camponoti]|uniref:Uncharacterized protein n=1 Tax=Amycolatopsis camponoti TaxID=2606593 RepID=A0A6I8M888_9PSEU|nr:Uncharacterised protein [Amycolatopsis camponoti]
MDPGRAWRTRRSVAAPLDLWSTVLETGIRTPTRPAGASTDWDTVSPQWITRSTLPPPRVASGPP